MTQPYLQNSINQNPQSIGSRTVTTAANPEAVALAGDPIVLIDATAGQADTTLPFAASVDPGYTIVVQKTDATALRDITFAVQAGDIQSGAFANVTTQWGVAKFQSDGNLTWYQIV